MVNNSTTMVVANKECPGGSLGSCISMCPVTPPEAYEECLAMCTELCDGTLPVYPEFQIFPEKSMSMSVAYLRADTRSSDLFFCSPANYVFDFPETTADDAVAVLHNPAQVFRGEEEPDLEYITTDADFPNDVQPTPADFDSFLDTTSTSPIIVTTGRFPLEGNENWANGLAGEVFIQNGETRISISGKWDPVTNENKWYYSSVKFIDVNEDGLLDILFARNVEAPPPFPGFDFFWNQFGYFEQPAEGAAAGFWPVHVLHNKEWSEDIVNTGGGTSFDIADLDGDGVFEMVFANFWGESVGILYTDSWVNETSPVNLVTVESSLGYMYGVAFRDLNGDGKLDIVATNHALIFPGFAPATLSAYEIEDFRSPSGFTRHLIDQSFRGRFVIYGFAVGNVDTIDVPGLKPMLALTTDGGGEYYLYKANSQNVDDWSYTRELLGKNDCDFIAPYVYVDPNDSEQEKFLLSGCLGLGYIYGGKLDGL